MKNLLVNCLKTSFCLGFGVLAVNVQAADEEFLQKIEQLFQHANVIAGPSLTDCTLSGGTAAKCFSLTVVAEPQNHTPGPWCPEHIDDTADKSGIWLEGGAVYDTDGKFLENMATFYNDSKWQLFDPETGRVNVTDTKESCAAAARPNVDEAYQNHCVQCLPEYMEDSASVTFTIPVKPQRSTDKTYETRTSGSGIAFNGVRLDGPAPVDAILGSYTIAPFDDCGGHVNLNVGYHYHAVTDCLQSTAEVSTHGEIIGLAMDGHPILARVGTSGSEPADLDICGGHTTSSEGYHYHAGKPGSNAILSCLSAETGCVSANPNAACDASIGDRRGGKRPQGGRPDFAAAARILNVSEAELKNALGGPPPNIDKASSVLGISADALKETLDSTR